MQMNKKVIALIVVIILLVIIGVVYFMNQNSNQNANENQERLAQTETNNETNNNVTSTDGNSETNSNEVATEGTNEVSSNTTSNENNSDAEGGKTLVVYYSAQGHTQEVAQKIANNLGADLFEIVPVNEYSSADLDWTDDNSRVSREYEDETLRNVELVSTTVDNWDEYDTVIIGYPIWWGIAAWPVDTFVTANDFTGKTVIPFCTSASSGLGQSGELLAEEAGTGNWLEGQRFSSNPSDSDINAWTDSLQ